MPVATSLERPLSSGRRAARAVVRAIPLPGTSQCAAPSIATAGPAILAAGGLASRLASMAPLAADGERVADLARLAIGVALARLDDSRGNPAADVAGGRRGLADSSPVAFGDLVAAGRSEGAVGAAGRPRVGRRSWTRRARAVGCGSSGTARQQQSQSDAGGRRKNGTCALAFGQGDGERYTGVAVGGREGAVIALRLYSVDAADPAHRIVSRVFEPRSGAGKDGTGAARRVCFRGRLAERGGSAGERRPILRRAAAGSVHRNR